MKRIVTILMLMTVTVVPLMAQYTKGGGCEMTFIYQTKCFDLDVWGNGFYTNLMYPIADRWRAGGGSAFESVKFKEYGCMGIPDCKVMARRWELGAHGDVQFLLGSNHRVYHSLNMQLSAKYLHVSFTSEDERAEHIVEPEDGGSYASYEYSIMPENKGSWSPFFMSTLRLTYMLDYSLLHFEVGVGYDLVNTVYRRYRNAPTTLTSTWDDFGQYYPTNEINPFTDWECGKKMAKAGGFHVVIGIGVNVVEFLHKISPNN